MPKPYWRCGGAPGWAPVVPREAEVQGLGPLVDPLGNAWWAYCKGCHFEYVANQLRQELDELNEQLDAWRRGREQASVGSQTDPVDDSSSTFPSPAPDA